MSIATAQYNGRKEPRLRAYVPQPQRPLPLLTTRQAEVVQAIREGTHSIKEIASEMGWEVSTTKQLLWVLYRRLQAHGYRVDNLTSLAIFAFSPETMRVQ